MVVYDDTSPEPVRVFDSGVDLADPETFGEYQLSYRTGDIVSPRVEVAEPLLLELLTSARRSARRREPRSSARLGARRRPVIEAVDESLARQRRARRARLGARLAAPRPCFRLFGSEEATRMKSTVTRAQVESLVRRVFGSGGHRPRAAAVSVRSRCALDRLSGVAPKRVGSPADLVIVARPRDL